MATQTATKMELRPLSDRVLVKPDADAAEKVGSIYVPDTAKERPQRGEVVAVGPGRKSDKGDVVAMNVKAGDKVLYSKYGGTELEIEGEDYLIMSESDILGVYA
jgi:chaperonin GroES